MRAFELYRDVDATGISGVGVVAEGVEFTDGTCAMRWLTERRSTCVYDTAVDLVLIHGHNGATRIVWSDLT